MSSPTFHRSRECLGHTGAVNAVRFTNDGQYAMSCSDDRGIQLFNPHRDDPKHENKALLIKSYTGNHSYAIYDLAISNDNSKFVAAGSDRNIFYYDVATGNVIKRINGHLQRVNAVALNKDGTVLLSASDDQTLKAWDLRSNTRDPIQILDQFKDSVTSIAQNSSAIAAGCVDGQLRIFDIRSGYLHADYLHDPITSIKYTPNEKALLCMCIGGYVRLIDAESGLLIQEYNGSHIHTSFKMESVISNDSNMIICGSEDGTAAVYDFLSGDVKQKLTIGSPQLQHGHKKVGHVHSLSYHPKLSLLLTATTDGIVRSYESS